MVGSRFDFSSMVAEARSRSDEALREASCIRLEREMAAIAQSIHARRPRVRFRCPVCDEPMHLDAAHDLEEFGSLNVELHKLDCRCCGMLADRIFHPALGYSREHVR